LAGLSEFKKIKYFDGWNNNVIYKVFYKDYNASYVGQTKKAEDET